jgi:hypothetical protein
MAKAKRYIIKSLSSEEEIEHDDTALTKEDIQKIVDESVGNIMKEIQDTFGTVETEIDKISERVNTLESAKTVTTEEVEESEEEEEVEESEEDVEISEDELKHAIACALKNKKSKSSKVNGLINKVLKNLGTDETIEHGNSDMDNFVVDKKGMVSVKLNGGK